MCGNSITQGSGEVHLALDGSVTTTTLHCTVSYVGFYAPSMAWYDEHGILIHNTSTESPPGTVTSSLVILGEDIHQNTHVTCRTYFTDPPEFVDANPTDQKSFDQSAPLYQDNCVVYINYGS